MIRSRVLWVLAQIARRDDGDLRAARVSAYGETDPVVRGWVQRRVERAVSNAIFETTRGDDERHVHRLAYLQTAGPLDAMADDIDGVRLAFEACAARRPPSRRGATFATLAMLLASVALVGGIAFWITRPPLALREELPPTRDAWVRGGRPLPGGPEVRAVFAERLPHAVVQLDALRRARETGDTEEAARRLDEATGALVAESRTALGPDATSFLRAVLDQSREIVEVDGAAAAGSHLRSVDALVAAIAARGLGYYVDAEVMTESATGRHRVYLSTFTVERVSLYEADGGRVRALRLRRLDRLSFARSVLGFTRPEVQDGLVLMGRIEGYLVDALLPALGPDAPMALVDEESRGAGAWVEAVERAAGEDARDEAAGALSEDARVLGELLARRRALLDRWATRFAADGIGIARPATYDFDPEAYAPLEPRVPSAEWRELSSVARGLRDDVHRQTYRDYEELFVASVERHEVQHRLDYAAGTLDTLPPALEEVTGALRVSERQDSRAHGAVAELSAYLSELARDRRIVKTNLALFSRHLFHRRRWGSGESYAALLVFERLGEVFGVSHGPLHVGWHIDREALATLYLGLRAHDAGALAEAAGALWAELFGRPLAALERIPPSPPAP